MHSTHQCFCHEEVSEFPVSYFVGSGIRYASVFDALRPLFIVEVNPDGVAEPSRTEPS